jgi:Leucine-rich repeat (LRR) protein
MRKTLLLTLTTASIAYGAMAQNVNIPDANFKFYLLAQSSINTNADTEIQLSEAVAYSGPIDCEGYNISSLTGIEAFTSLTELNCGDNPLTTLNVSSNTALTELRCYANDLTSLDVSNNTLLTRLNCSDNQITSLDLTNNVFLQRLDAENNLLATFDITNNTLLTRLNCNNNALTQLNINSNLGLEIVECDNNLLTSLNVSNNTQLRELYCTGNGITQLDVSNNIALEQLGCGENSLTALNVSNNTALTALGCGGGENYLTTLDVSNNPALFYLECESNRLTQLNVKNGNNLNFTDFYAANNPNLTCIQVDDAAYSTTFWTDVDGTASFNEVCLSTGIAANVSDIQLVVYPNPAHNVLNVESDVTFINFSLINTLGQVVAHNEVLNNRIDVAHINKGVYTLVLTTTEGKQTNKLVAVN